MDLLPHDCLLCNTRFDGTRDLCAHCHAALPWNTDPCPRCGQPDGSAGCVACLQHPVACDRTIAPLQYAGSVAGWVQSLKFSNGLRAGKVLAGLLGDAVAPQLSSGPVPDCIVPLPLATRRLLWRGHNQSAFLANVVARRVGLPVSNRLLRRSRYTQRQSDLPRSARRANVARAFTARGVDGQYIALVDDVLTTGATLQSATRALLVAGATAVEWWVAARTP